MVEVGRHAEGAWNDLALLNRQHFGFDRLEILQGQRRTQNEREQHNVVVAMNSKMSKGRSGEDRAASHLQSLGYTIITRNFHIRGGEIDIVALDGDILVFVEVRWRTDDLGEESVGPHKVSAIRKAVQVYRTEMADERDYRCDLIVLSPQELRHHQDFLGS